MKDIIIIGTSKAGFLHFKSYNKLKNKGKIFFVDISENINNKNILVEKVYKSISDVLYQNNISNEDVIVDICVPREEFYNIINQCINLKINDIIVEKPFITSKKFLDKNSKLNIVMIQNYLYSNITKDIRRLIKENNYSIKMIYTNFSKNRINDSIKRRGMSKIATQNFEVEIPHQIYLADYILEDDNNKEVLFKEQSDFKINDIYLQKHAYGRIILKQADKIVIHESDLITNNPIKEITIICNDGIVINAEFILYDKDLNKIKNGKIIIKKSNDIIHEEQYEEDDNMYNCINEYYKYFNDGIIEEKYKNRIIEFSNMFERIIEK